MARKNANEAVSEVDEATGEIAGDVPELSEGEAHEESFRNALGEAFDDEDDFVTHTTDGELIFIRPEEGLTIRGMLLGRFKKPGENNKGSGFCYRLKLTEPGQAAKGKKKDLTVFIAPKGTVVMVDDRKAMEVLAPLAEKVLMEGAKVEVILRYGALKETTGGQEFWQTQIKTRIVKN